MGHGFPRERDNKLYLKLYMTKDVLLICQMMPRMLGFGGGMTDFGGIGISRFFGA
jgi:hypothetical protein